MSAEIIGTTRPLVHAASFAAGPSVVRVDGKVRGFGDNDWSDIVKSDNGFELERPVSWKPGTEVWVFRSDAVRTHERGWGAEIDHLEMSCLALDSATDEAPGVVCAVVRVVGTQATQMRLLWCGNAYDAAVYLRKRGDLERALEYATRAWLVHPDARSDSDILLGLRIGLLEDMGRHDEARSWRRVLERLPNNAETL